MLVSSMKHVLFVSALTAASSIPSTLQASLRFFVDPSFSFESDDEPDNWSTDAKLKLKVGVVSVTVNTAYGGSAARQSMDVGPLNATWCQHVHVMMLWNVSP